MGAERTFAMLTYVIDEGAPGAGIFLSEIGLEGMPHVSASEAVPTTPPTLYRLSDASGRIAFESVVPAARSTISSSDAYLHSVCPILLPDMHGPYIYDCRITRGLQEIS